MKRAIIVGVHLAALVGATLGTVYAAQSVKHARVDMASEVTDDTVYLPSNRVLRMSSLGYGAFWSDMMFIRTHAWFLRHMYGDRLFRWLERYVDAIVVLDPDNREAYNWAATVVRYGQNIDEQTIARSNRFAELGVERFPDDPRLYAHMGFNDYFELRPRKIEEEGKLQTAIRSASSEAAREALFGELATVRAERYTLERQALMNYTIAAMLPNSRIDPVFLVTLYIKHDEASAATQAITALYGQAHERDQEQLLARLKILGKDSLAERLKTARKSHQDDMPFLSPGLHRLLAGPDDLKVPERWDSTGIVLDTALEVLEREREKGVARP